MKSKRLLSCVLALALALTMVALPASAATFPDITNHWAKSYIEEMTDAGMFKGYDDGKFKPENKLTTAEALALCARAVPITDTAAARIAEARKAEVEGIMNGEQPWFYKEFAICLETGILSYTDLKSLYQGGAFSASSPKYIAKEDLSVYLVRAMQLGAMAEGMEGYSLTFTDTASINTDAKPYVYLLNIYGIVQGDDKNAYSPKLEVTRAVMATMLSRALKFMDERGTIADLPAYSTYEFTQGGIAAVTSGDKGVVVLTLNNDLTNVASSISLPADVEIYENNMAAVSSALKAGKHARIALNGKGAATAVYLSTALTTLTGTVNGIEDGNLALTVNGVGYVLALDRFTQVQIGTKTVGGPSVVDESAGYTNAVCQLDDQGRLVAVRLTGGTRAESGIISSVEKAATTTGNTILRVVGFDGMTHQYTVPSGAAVTVNGLSGTLSTGHKGSYVSLRVSNEDGSAITVSVDSVTDYVQGGIKAFTYQSSTNSMTITDTSTDKSTSYNISSKCTITYNGEDIELKKVEKGWFATVRLSGGAIVQIDCYPGSTVTEGVVTSRSFSTNSTNVTLEVSQADDTVVSFTMDLSSPPTIERSGEKSTIDKLRVGDEVVVTVRYNAVTSIEATPQTANMTGTIDRIIQEVGGSTLEMTLATGEEVSYLVTSATSITQNGKEVGVAALKPGYRLAMVINGDQISSIEIQQVASSQNQVSGTVIYVNSTGNKYITLRAVDEAGNENILQVNVDSSTKLMEWDGDSLYLRDLSAGDTLQINGAYNGNEFNASVILRSGKASAS